MGRRYNAPTRNREKRVCGHGPSTPPRPPDRTVTQLLPPRLARRYLRIVKHSRRTEMAAQVPFYRFLHENGEAHFYTIDYNEGSAATGYKLERIECLIHNAGDAGGIPFVRYLHNVKHYHFYTMNEWEVNDNIK